METKTYENLKAEGKSKGETFAQLKAQNVTFDFALPQDWLNEVAKYAEWGRTMGGKNFSADVTYDLIRSTTVWAYPNDGQNYFNGKPLTCCTEVEQVIKVWYHDRSAGNYEWSNTVKGKV